MVDVGGGDVGGDVGEVLEDGVGLVVQAGADGGAGGEQVRRAGHGLQGAEAAHAHADDVHPAAVHLPLGDEAANDVHDPAQVLPGPAPVDLLVTGVGPDDDLMGVSLAAHLGEHLLHGEAARGSLGRHDVHVGHTLGELDGANGVRELQQVILAAAAAPVKEQHQGPGAEAVRLIEAVVDAVLHHGLEQILVIELHIVRLVLGDNEAQLLAGHGKVDPIEEGLKIEHKLLPLRLQGLDPGDGHRGAQVLVAIGANEVRCLQGGSGLVQRDADLVHHLAEIVHEGVNGDVHLNYLLFSPVSIWVKSAGRAFPSSRSLMRSAMKKDSSAK